MRFQDRCDASVARACLRHLATAAFVLGLQLAMPPTGAVGADELRCAGTNVSVHALDSTDADTGCKGAMDAVTFLATQGLDTTIPVEIRFVEKLPKAAGSSAFGCYVHAERRVYLLTYDTCSKQTFGPDVPIDRALHRSLVAHEVAHRIAAVNFTYEKPTTIAHEYIAYVTMFATMPSDQRTGLLARFPGTGFDTERQIDVVIYQLNPDRFGAQAYRHFVKPGNGKPFLERILSGRALAVEEP